MLVSKRAVFVQNVLDFGVFYPDIFILRNCYETESDLLENNS